MSAVYNAAIDRAEAGPTIPEDAAHEIIQAAVEKSFVLSTFDRVNMSRKQRRMPILDRKPLAYFVNGDTGLKQTTDMRWDNIFLNAEEIAVLLPIPDTIVADSEQDLWAQAKPHIGEAIGAVTDDAVLFGTGKPSLWPTGVVPATAAAAGNQITAAVTSATHDIFDDLNAALVAVEEDGYEPDAWLMRSSLRGTLRNQRDANRGFLYPPSGPANTGAANARWAGEVWNVPAKVSKMGLSGFSPGASNTLAIAFDTSMFKVAIRDDINMRMFDQGVISDASGVVILNLMQQDVRVLRVTFRLAWVAANPVTRMQSNRAAAYPAASVLQGTFVGLLASAQTNGQAQLTAGEGGEEPQLTTAGGQRVLGVEYGGVGSGEPTEEAPATAPARRR